MVHYLIVQVDGREQDADLKTLRDGIHNIIEQSCMRAGDIVLRGDRSEDSLGNPVSGDYRTVGNLYIRRADTYRAARVTKAAARAARAAEREARQAARVDDPSVPQESPDPTRPPRQFVRDRNGRFASRAPVESTPSPGTGSVSFTMSGRITAGGGWDGPGIIWPTEEIATLEDLLSGTRASRNRTEWETAAFARPVLRERPVDLADELDMCNTLHCGQQTRGGERFHCTECHRENREVENHRLINDQDMRQYSPPTYADPLGEF